MGSPGGRIGHPAFRASGGRDEYARQPPPPRGLRGSGVGPTPALTGQGRVQPGRYPFRIRERSLGSRTRAMRRCFHDRMPSTVEDRMALLERSVRRTRWSLAVVVMGLAIVAGIQITRRPPAVPDEVRARRLVIVDDAGRTRVEIAQDPRDSQRRSRSVGLTVFDSTGAERGGLSTYDDGTVGYGMDSPRGVGAAMGERLSMSVGADGSADVMLLDNLTRAVTRLQSDGDGNGGVQVFKWDMEGKRIRIRTVVYDGDRHETMPMN